ncbi:MAG TPA: GAF domain-containing protein, partial [Telluria sp.]
MSANALPASQQSETNLRLAFFRKLQAVTTRIHATRNLDEIMLDLGMDFCDLFNCDRFTLYAVTPEKDHIVSKVKTGLTSFRDLRLSISPSSIAGWVAQTRRTINVTDVYDEAELKRLSPELSFQRGVDQRTGYRTREMLVAPLEAVQSGELLGVVQFINNRGGGPFSQVCVEGVKELCETLSVAFSQRLQPSQLVRTKYDSLVADAVISPSEFEQAQRSARKDGRDIEAVLASDLEVSPALIG